MAGRIQFDREKAVEAAAKVFWQKGFTATSMQDLKQATGIRESSLYNTFGNKESLFKEALARYRKSVMDNFGALPHLEKPRQTLEMTFQNIARLATTEQGAAGCMMMNSAMELGGQHPDIADYARETYAQIEDWLYETVKRGQELGEINPNHDPRSLARYLRFNIQAIFAVARTHPDKEFMDDVAETILNVL